MLPVIILFFVNFISFVENANILCFTPMPFPSHAIGYKPLFLELSRRGHNVTVVTPYPEKKKDIPDNYHQIIVPDILHDIDIVNEKNDFTGFSGRLRFLAFIWDLCAALTEKCSQFPQVQNLIHSESDNFDLILTENFHQEAFVSLGHKFNSPVVGLIPITPTASINKWAGNPSTFSYLPDVRLGYTDKMSFLERTENFIHGVFQLVVEDWVYFPKQKSISDNIFNYEGFENRPCLDDMMRNISINLIFSDSTIFFPRPLVPSFVEVSGLHIEESELSQELQDAMDNAKSGVIYMSFGTHVSPEMLPTKQVILLLKIFEKMPQTIFWKYEPKENVFVPKNVILKKWFPQTAILAHPNCQLFITHGGIHSILETVYFGVPILGMPFFSDQHTNLFYAQDKGYALVSDYQTFTEDSLVPILQELLNNSTYKQNVKELSILYHDKPISPMDTATYWIEYVLRHRNVEHLKSASANLNLIQSNLLDVIAFLLFSVFIVISIIKKIISRFFR